jgi:hypothetical protein
MMSGLMQSFYGAVKTIFPERMRVVVISVALSAVGICGSMK